MRKSSEATITGRTTIIRTTAVEPSVRERWVYSAVVFFFYAVLGAGDSLDGPSLPDLAHNMDVQFGQVSEGVAVYSLAHCIAAFFFGFVFRVTNRQKVLVLVLLVFGMGLFAMPQQRHLLPFYGLEAMIGVCDTGVDIAANAWMLELWQESGNPVMQGLHFVSAFTRTVSLLSVPLFLSTDSQSSRISIPYSISSILMCMASTALFTLSCVMPYQQPERPELEEERHISTIAGSLSCENVNQVPADSPVKRCFKLLAIVLMGSLIVVFSSSVDRMMSYFMPSFAMTLGYKKLDSSLMSGVYQASFATGRLICAFAAFFVSVESLMFTCFCLMVTGNVTFLLFGRESEAWVWTGIVITGLGCSTNYPSVFVLLDHKINVTNTVSSCLVFSRFSALAVQPVILAHVMNAHPFVFVYMNLISVCACFLILLLFMAFCRLCFR